MDKDPLRSHAVNQHSKVPIPLLAATPGTRTARYCIALLSEATVALRIRGKYRPPESRTSNKHRHLYQFDKDIKDLRNHNDAAYNAGKEATPCRVL
jgi:hypothetical protein